MSIFKRTSITLMSLFIALVGVLSLFLIAYPYIFPKIMGKSVTTELLLTEEDLHVSTEPTHTFEQANAVVNNGSQRELIR